MSTITIPAISKYWYIIPTKSIDQTILDNSTITITIVSNDALKNKKKAKNKLDKFLWSDYKKDLSKPTSMDNFINELQAW